MRFHTASLHNGHRLSRYERQQQVGLSLRLASAAAMSMDQIHQRTCMHSLCWHRLTDSPVSSLNFCFVQVLIGSLYE